MPHPRNDGPGKVGGAEKVQLDGLSPFLGGGGEEHFGRGPSGVGDADVDGAEFPADSFDKPMHGCLVGDVDGYGEDFRGVARADLVRGGLELGCIAGAHGDPRALGGEFVGCGSGDALAGGGDDNGAAFEA